ncbi:hypothetical protein MRBLMC3_002918 [Sphingobium sp. LMC3-1-1.1]|uniref:hypothetical protein n=1 Tax=Sphingobium sp. LMC3-1-1.1 TaxID=3135241 RepID=UPI00342B6F08
MGDFLIKNRLVLAKVETTAGTDASPVPATDAILCEEPRVAPNMELERTNEVTGSLDSMQSIVGGGYVEHSQRVFAKGSGTPGTAPEMDPYLKAGALGLTTLAAASTGTAQAGAAASITLAAGAPSTDLKGFVIVTTGGIGPGQTRVITAYNTTTKVAAVYPNWDVEPDATTTYSVKAGNLYIPASAALKTITSYVYQKNSGTGNAILKKLLGGAANIAFAIQTRQTGKFTFTLRGVLSDPEDVANPAAGVFDATRPRPLRDADAFLDGTRVCFRNFTLDWGNVLTQADCPGATYGYDPARVTDRRATGRINPQMKTLSERNAWADMVAGTTKPLWLNWGEVDGNRISIFIPAISYTGNEEEDLDGIAADGLPFEAVGPDSWVYLLFW